jgi:hypothetical protein
MSKRKPPKDFENRDKDGLFLEPCATHRSPDDFPLVARFEEPYDKARLMYEYVVIHACQQQVLRLIIGSW